MLPITHPVDARPQVLATGRPSLLARVDTAWRLPLAGAALVAAAAHVPVTPEHLHEALYIGVLFVLLEIASVALAIELLLRPTRIVLAATAAVGVLAVLALVLSRTVGLPEIGDDVGDWLEPLAVVSLVAEGLMVLGALLALRRRGPRVPARVGVAAGIAVLLLGAIATGLATAAEAPPLPDAQRTTGGMTGMDMGLPAPGAAATS